MNLDELTRLVAEDTGDAYTNSKIHTQVLLKKIKEHVFENGEKLTLVGFGTFSRKTRTARTGRNPSTGESMKIPAKYVLHFKPASTMKCDV